MAKTIKQSTFNVDVFFGTAAQHLATHATHAATVEAIQPMLTGATLTECVATLWAGMNAEDTSRAGQAAALISTREALEAADIDTGDADAVTEALRLPLWKAAGYASVQKLVQPKALPEGANAKAVKAYEAAVAAYEELKPVYNRVNKRLERIVARIVGVEAEEVPVPRKLQELIDAALEYEGAQIKRALELGRAKRKAAKAKAAKKAK